MHTSFFLCNQCVGELFAFVNLTKLIHSGPNLQLSAVSISVECRALCAEIKHISGDFWWII